jgi:starch-binding outer membrane protein, SusD/RagB family
MTKTPMPLNRLSGRRAAVAIALTGAMGLAGCNQDKLLTVATPDVVRPSDLSSAAALPNAYNAAIGDFGLGYAGSGTSEGLVLMSGLLADELYDAETFPTRIEVDMRRTNPINNTMLPIYRNIHRARATAELVTSRYATLDPTNANRAEIQALDAYTYILFAENYCGAVPTSRLDASGAFVYGNPQTTAQMLTVAIAKLDSAIALATSLGAVANDPTKPGYAALNLATIGKGRAQVDQGNYAAAAATVASVPTGFAYNILHDENTTRQNNGVYAFTYASKRLSVSSKEGTNGLPFFADSTDYRVAAFRNGGGFTATIPFYQTAKYQGFPIAGVRNSPTPLALGTEARLIEAEAALAASDDITFLAKLNLARANSKTYIKGNNPAPPPPGPLVAADLGADAVSRVDLLFKERAYDLFLTSHRLGDLRRLIRQYGRGAETVFPTGNYIQGSVYDKDVNLPVPFEEGNNPSYTAAGCVTTAP